MILTEILKENAQKYPNTKAVTMHIGYRAVTLTYKQVYELAKKTALFLQQNDIKKGDKVFIFAQNSPYWGVLFWGIMLCGAVAVPLNVQSTSDMISKIVEQTGGTLFFKSRFLKRDLPENLKIYDIDFLDELIESLDIKDFKEPELSEDDLIEILYTSGTTGDPKGVLLTHKNISSNLESIAEFFTFKPGTEKLLSILPLTHIFEQTIGFFLAFFYKGEIVYTHSYSAIAELLQKYKVTKMLAVPEFLKVLMSKMRAELEKKKLLKLFDAAQKLALKVNCNLFSRILFYPIRRKIGNIDTIASGGAFLEPELEKQWNALGITILQGYGLTETSPVVTCNTYIDRKVGSVGRVVKNVEVKLAEDGEIFVKGPNVFQGYFNNEEKTKECFTSDGFFKTGDIGKFDEDNFLFLSGRKKYVIVGPGGQNVFPEDIELELNRLDGVKDCAVLGIETPSGMIEIHAVVLPESGIDNLEEIVNKANSKLASYQQITGYTIWPFDDFPRSATRKVKKEDVKRYILEKKGTGQVEKNGEDKTPLFKILSQISGVDIARIKKDTKIIHDLKFDSLTLVEFFLRVEQDCGVVLDPSHINAKTTVLDLEEIIAKKEPVPRPPELKKWPRSWWASIIRTLLQYVSFLLLRIFVKFKVEGAQNLKDLKLPVIFMPNHVSYIDGAIVSMTLPFKIRKKLTFAAAKDVLYKDYKYIAWLVDLIFDSFVFPREESQNIAFGLNSMGSLLDQGYSVVVFPEGKMSLDGKLLPLKKGAGLMAVEMNTFIVPVKLVGAEKVVPYDKILPRHFGTVTVKIGKPIKFKKSDNYDDAVKRIEMELEKL